MAFCHHLLLIKTYSKVTVKNSNNSLPFLSLYYTANNTFAIFILHAILILIIPISRSCLKCTQISSLMHSQPFFPIAFPKSAPLCVPHRSSLPSKSPALFLVSFILPAKCGALLFCCLLISFYLRQMPLWFGFITLCGSSVCSRASYSRRAQCLTPKSCARVFISRLWLVLRQTMMAVINLF